MFCVKFHKGGNRIFVFLLETSKVFCFGVLKFSISSLSFWGFSKKLCEVFTSEETRYVPFFM